MSFPNGFDDPGPSVDDLSVDDFLGGRVHIAQPVKGYRAGVDPVLLAASVPALQGQTVLELGCGSGVASLCLAARVRVQLTGVELQPAYAELAEQNAARNDTAMRVICANLQALPEDLRQRQFNHVIANPPYYDRARSTAASEPGRETGLGENTPLADWIRIAAKRLAPSGYLTVIQKADRLPDLIRALPAPLGSVAVQPFAPRAGKPAHLIILQAKKGGRANFSLKMPIIMHQGAVHDENRKNYSTLIEQVLREGAGLPMSNSTK